jgi:hypothetical protein
MSKTIKQRSSPASFFSGEKATNKQQQEACTLTQLKLKGERAE